MSLKQDLIQLTNNKIARLNSDRVVHFNNGDAGMVANCDTEIAEAEAVLAKLMEE